MFTLNLTRDEVIALSRAMQEWLKSAHPDDEDALTTRANLYQIVEKLPDPEELDAMSEK